jgi:L-fucose mutarotase
MLKNIASCISPDLLKVLAEMGHGDEIVLADAHFPGHSMNARVLRADGVPANTLLGGILPLFELDSHADPLVMMAAMEGDQLDLQLEIRYLKTIRQFVPAARPPVRIDRFAFYERTRKSFAVVITGETGKYGNILLKKGIILVHHLSSNNPRIDK